MKNLRPKCIAIKALLFAALLAVGGTAWAAQVAGMVTRLSGPLMAKKSDGSVKVLALRSEVESGDTLVSEKNTYAQIKFVDNSEITLRPGTTFKIEDFAYDEGKPDGDKANFNLVKGGLRSITGLMGKRNKEKFSLKTPTATIGIRGTTFIAHYVPPPPGVNPALKPAGQDKPDVTPPPGMGPQLPLPPAGPGGAQGKLPPTERGMPPGPALPPGLHVSVLDGMIHVVNTGGAQNFSAGQFGYVPNPTLPPVVVPQNPGLQFTPPPTFNTNSGPDLSGQREQDTVDCIVR